MTKDFINVYDDALPSKDCKNIIDIFDTWPNKGKGCIADGVYDPKVKDCQQISLHLYQNNTINDYLLKALVKCTPLYTSENPELKLIKYWNIYSGYNIQQYKPGQGYFDEHCECSAPDNSVYRVLAWMIYLNTVDDGGTYFTNYDKTLDAVEGRCVIWPAYWTHTHRGITSHTQTKYIATGWYNFE